MPKRRPDDHTEKDPGGEVISFPYPISNGSDCYPSQDGCCGGIQATYPHDLQGGNSDGDEDQPQDIRTYSFSDSHMIIGVGDLNRLSRYLNFGFRENVRA